MAFWKCDNHRPVKSDSSKEAAEIFAKRKYPRCDYFIVNQNSYYRNSVTFNVFVGKYNKRTKTAIGKQIQIVVSRF